MQKETAQSLVIIGNLILCIAFVYMLIAQIENENSVKVPYLSLILFLVFVFLNLVTLLSTNVNMSHKIFYFVSFIAIVGMIYIKVTTRNENYCNQNKPFVPDEKYDKYYKKVMNRGSNDLIQPYKRVYGRVN